eukprot:1647699-Prymnesium_polylepis.1
MRMRPTAVSLQLWPCLACLLDERIVTGEGLQAPLCVWHAAPVAWRAVDKPPKGRRGESRLLELT